MRDRFRVYGTPVCPKVLSAVTLLIQAGIHFEYINILENSVARHYVQEVNQGYESVPTLVFPDGSTLTEPNPSTLKSKLKSLGYDVPFSPIWVKVIRYLGS